MEPNTATYKAIREDIVNDIIRGIYEPGSTIPKQEDYAAKFGVSRGTVRRAIDELVKRGVLQTTKGRGTVVADYKESRVLARRNLSFHDTKRIDRQELVSRVVEISTLHAPPWLARQLCINVGAPVVHIKRVRIVNGHPENYQFSYFAKQQMGNIDFEKADLVHGSLFGLIAGEAGLYATGQDEEIRAVRCPENVAEELEMKAGEPVVLIIRTVYSQNDMPLEYCEDYECTDIKGLKISSRSKNKE